MTMFTALSILAAMGFGLALFLFDYIFTRYMGNEDTEQLAAIMHAIHDTDTPAGEAKRKTASAA